MPLRSEAALAEMRDVLLETYTINDAMNQLLLTHLDPRSWHAELPGAKGNGRTIAAIFAHLHNNRLSWLKNFAPPEMSGTARSRPLHDEASRGRSQEERDAMPPHAHRRFVC